jgi:hypothetical protein
LLFNLRDPNEELADLSVDIDAFKKGTAVVSLASFAYDGAVSDALWAVDRSTVGLVNEDRGTGTANIQISASLAVRGFSGIILRVSYTAFLVTNAGAISA